MSTKAYKRAPLGTTILATAALLLMGPGLAQRAHADGSSERLYSLGLVEFHKSRYPQALGLFDRAVRADSEDARARYYRGVTRGRIGDFEAAAEDLRGVVERDPGMASASLELGYALFRLGEHEAAAPHLQRARGEEGLEGRASLFLGITELRRDLVRDARRNFSRAARVDPELALQARFYQGVADYRLGDFDTAESNFRYVTERGFDTQMGREAEAYLDKIRAADVQRYQLYARAGIEYDSNVSLEPIDDGGVFEGGDESDGRVTITAGARYAALRTAKLQVITGYELFQSLHFELGEFDIQDHRFSIDLSTRGTERVSAGLSARYDYYLKDTKNGLRNFLSEPTILPWLRFDQPGFGRLDLHYRWQQHRFLESPFDDLSDGINNAVGIRQTVYLDGPERFAYFGYRHDNEVARRLAGRAFAYEGDQLDAGVGWRLPADVDASVRYSYRHESYDAESRIDPLSGMATLPQRKDDQQELSIGLERRLREHMWIRGSYTGMLNDSNQEAQGFQYERHIGEIALELRY